MNGCELRGEGGLSALAAWLGSLSRHVLALASAPEFVQALVHLWRRVIPVRPMVAAVASRRLGCEAQSWTSTDAEIGSKCSQEGKLGE